VELKPSLQIPNAGMRFTHTKQAKRRWFSRLPLARFTTALARAEATLTDQTAGQSCGQLWADAQVVHARTLRWQAPATALPTAAGVRARKTRAVANLPHLGDASFDTTPLLDVDFTTDSRSVLIVRVSTRTTHSPQHRSCGAQALLLSARGAVRMSSDEDSDVHQRRRSSRGRGGSTRRPPRDRSPDSTSPPARRRGVALTPPRRTGPSRRARALTPMDEEGLGVGASGGARSGSGSDGDDSSAGGRRAMEHAMRGQGGSGAGGVRGRVNQAGFRASGGGGGSASDSDSGSGAPPAGQRRQRAGARDGSSSDSSESSDPDGPPGGGRRRGQRRRSSVAGGVAVQARTYLELEMNPYDAGVGDVNVHDSVRSLSWVLCLSLLLLCAALLFPVPVLVSVSGAFLLPLSSVVGSSSVSCMLLASCGAQPRSDSCLFLFDAW